MFRAHRIQLDPTNKQRTYFQKAAGVSRFTYNWALAEWQRQYNLYKDDPDNAPRPSQNSLNKQLNATKRRDFPWMLEVTKCAPQEAIFNLGSAFQNFWRGTSKYPTFKKKNTSRDSFHIDNTHFSIDTKRVRVPKLGWVRMCEHLRLNGKIVSATISRTADKWYVSIRVELPDEPAELKPTANVIGVDLGIKDLATLSTGEKVASLDPHKRALKKLKRIQQKMARRQKGSANRTKTKTRLLRIHDRVVNDRKDNLHKLTTRLVNEYDVVAIEDLNVQGMVRNHSLARSISDASFGELRRQLNYKAEQAGTHIVIVDRFYPSSKTCSICGGKNHALTLSQRSWICDLCGAKHDRDINAASNLAQWARNYLSTAGSYSVAACGDEGSDDSLVTTVKPLVDEAGTRQQAVVSQLT